MLKITLANGNEFEVLGDTACYPSMSTTARSYMEIHMRENEMPMELFYALMTDAEGEPGYDASANLAVCSNVPASMSNRCAIKNRRSAIYNIALRHIHWRSVKYQPLERRVSFVVCNLNQFPVFHFLVTAERCAKANGLRARYKIRCGSSKHHHAICGSLQRRSEKKEMNCSQNAILPYCKMHRQIRKSGAHTDKRCGTCRSSRDFRTP